MRKVVVTGMGIVTSLGISIKDFWNNIINSQSGLEKKKFLNEDNIQVFSLIKDKDIKIINKILKKKERQFIDYFIKYAYFACQEALNSSLLINDLNNNTVDLHKIGVSVGSALGGISSIEKNFFRFQNKKTVSPFLIPYSIISSASSFISTKFKCKGPIIPISSACSSGSFCIGESLNIIRSGYADIMITGGSEAMITPFGINSFSSMNALSKNFNNSPKKASRPWDISRDGFILGEGAGILILEEYNHAKARNAKIFCEVVGFGVSSDGYNMVKPDKYGNGFIESMKNAIKDSKIEKDKINYINAHSASTIIGDLIEAKSIKKLFNNSSYPYVSSTKSMTGHLLGAAGAIEAIISILAIYNNIIPPTINIETLEKEIDTLPIIINKSFKKNIEYVLSNSFGFGGINSTLIFKKMKKDKI